MGSQMRVITRGNLKISRAISAAMMLRLSPLVMEAKPSAVPLPNHAARVDERGLWQRDPVARRRHLLPLLRKDSWQMRVAEEAKPLAKAHQDFKRLQLFQDVLPEIRFARAAMHKAMTAQP